MTTEEIKKFIDGCKKEDLTDFIAKLYEQWNEKIKVKIISLFIPKNKRPVKKIKEIDSNKFLNEVELFWKNVDEWLYVRSNKIISKKERSGWRIYVKLLLADCLTLIQSWETEVAYKSLEIILNALDKGSMKKHVFVSERALDAAKVDPDVWCKYMLDAFLKSNNYNYQLFYSHYIKIFFKWDFNSDNYIFNLYAILLDTCKTRDLKELLYLEAIKFYNSFKESHSQSIDWYDFITYYTDSYGWDSISCDVFKNWKKIQNRMYFQDLRLKKFYKEMEDNEKKKLYDFYKKVEEWKPERYINSSLEKFIQNWIDFFLSNNESCRANELVLSTKFCMWESNYQKFKKYFDSMKHN